MAGYFISRQILAYGYADFRPRYTTLLHRVGTDYFAVAASGVWGEGDGFVEVAVGFQRSGEGRVFLLQDLASLIEGRDFYGDVSVRTGRQVPYVNIHGGRNQHVLHVGAVNG